MRALVVKSSVCFLLRDAFFLAIEQTSVEAAEQTFQPRDLVRQASEPMNDRRPI
jgi:hypothetical protein